MIDCKPLIISRTLPHLGGRERIVQSMIEFFREKGVTIVTPDEFNPEIGVNVVGYRENKECWEKLIKELELFDFNIVHCHTFYLADFAIKVSEYFKIPLVFTLHGVFFDFYGDKYDGIIRRIAENSTIFTTVSARYREILQKFLNDERNLEVIPNGINAPPFIESKEEEKNNHRITVAVPARLNKIKGLDYLIESLPFIMENAEIHICSPNGRKVEGEVTYKEGLVNKIKTENIFFHDFDNDQWISFLRSADIVLLPSLIEGQSLAILESMSQKKIVIATNVGGTPEIISNGENGFLIEPKSSEAIYKSLNYVLNMDGEILDKIRGEARQTVLENFTFEKMMRSYLKIYEEAILLKKRDPKDVQAVIIKNPKNPEFLILKRLNKNSGNYEYRLVKGGIKKEEKGEETLNREIAEETGIGKVKILTNLKPYSYSYFLKRTYVTNNVNTYLVEAVSEENQDTINQSEEGGFNIESVLWVKKDEVKNILTYPQEQELIGQALQYLEQ